MERNFKITIPEPCHENWNKMNPNENGRYCLSCSKTVVDFTSMLPDEIQHFFIQNQNNRICGRFKNEQLDSVTIQIPKQVLHTQTNYYKMFLLALFVAMGTTLFSCQNKEGKKQKIDKVEVVEDTTQTPHATVGISLPEKNNTNDTLLPPPPPPKVDQVKFVKKPVKNTEKEKPAKINSKKVVEDESSFVTGAVMQTNAEFPGGIDRFYTFFAKEFKNPDNASAEKLKIRISFAVEKNGSVSYLQSEPVIEQPLEKEIIRVLSLCPKWEPGTSNGKKIRMQYSLPIVL
ncbi:hypothetical protein C8C83_1281 [Flavobacterium sp. 90]|uniref:hypothetical protein n=1 Tax=unclassified Flavobacterium TaxID=196869 RepID=UPI000F27B723|nr:MULTISPECIES: hypothetical protein [unclassified Flavobacterium]RKR09638.1 hypothetical protein C8C82_1582 [Flavobacterium sp. 81]TCK53422.1 hypothetical protein C8C83_1281 [Flavobacterium sp. 90]